ncbi:MAG: hypothetical protein IPJ89_02490 [Candidatus Iainarchaeum archaeon]|uniref:Uncharacterized protein n=1 Tax=Candidatus Iainarchaeum sp. TaxID=3101447 RepID=A0A7T9DKM8_9ARCH|nr:MAG: hypothetical protein IPJ89_02490 [Candidatus Diapherotrites archaeon]
MRIQTILIIGLILLFGGLAIAQSNTATSVAVPTAVTTTSASTTTAVVADADYCHAVDVLEEKATACRAAGKSYFFKTTSSNGVRCRDIECYDPASCPDDAEYTRAIDRCVNVEKVSYTKYQDDQGCTQIKCVAAQIPPTQRPDVTPDAATYCKKLVNEKGCVEIYCNDGYRYNSCEDTAACSAPPSQGVSCKAYTDSDGCYVQSCSNGKTDRSCPDRQSVKCEVEKLDDGCYIKKCSDGTKSTSCPQQAVTCSTERDSDGCVITKCDNGKYSKECPVADPVKEVKCEVFERSDGHKIKECDNGFRVDYTDLKAYCAKTGVNYENTDTAAATKCVYGDNGEYIARVSEDGTRTECVINFEAKTRYCTDGTVVKDGRNLTDPAANASGDITTTMETTLGNTGVTTTTATDAQGNSSPLDGLARFFASIFGGK